MPLVAEHVSVSYRGKSGAVQALQDVSLTVPPGKLVTVAGPSGSGKTTLLMTLGCLLSPHSGNVVFDGTNVYELPSSQRSVFRNRRIGFVFQQFHLIPYLSALENILTPALAGAAPAAHADPHELIRRFNLQDRVDHLPSELSTGERQRVALARALYNNPDIILADEPTGNLDEENGRIVIDHLQAIAREGRAVLVVTHDPRLRPQAAQAFSLIQGKLSRAVTPSR